MRVLMLSLDRGFFGTSPSGDVIRRHQEYANRVGELDVIVFAPPEFADRVISSNLRIFPTRSAKFFHFRSAAAIGRRLYGQSHYDLLVTQEFAAPAGLRLKESLALPWIVNVHSMFFSAEWLGWNPLNWYLLWRVKQALRRADGFRVNNETIRGKLLSWGIRAPSLVQPTLVDIKKFFSPSKPRNATLKILYVGRLSPEKNVGMLIRVAKTLSDSFRLEIVGTGAAEKTLRQMAGEDERIVFLGARAHDELPEVYRQADIFVLPSNTESYGKVLLEAAGSRCAIVATKTTGAMSILENERTGLLIPVGDGEALRQALETLLRDGQFRLALAERAGQMAGGYDWDLALEKTIAFWKEVAGR